MNRILILGGGCAGLSVARALRFTAVQITLVDREAAYLFQSRLYAAAAGLGEPRNLRVRRESLLRAQKNVECVAGEGVFLDAPQRRLILADRALPYDLLVVATGVKARYEREEWQGVAPALKSAEDAARIRQKLQDRDSTVVILGGGVSGVELAAAVAPLDRTRRVVLVEEGARLLPSFPDNLAQQAEKRLRQMGVEIRFGLRAIGMDRESVRLSGSEGRERILSRAILWAGGVCGSGFGAMLNKETGVPLDEAGRVCVQADLTLPGHPEIFVIGDLARVIDHGSPLDGLATVASQQGRYVASSIRERMAGYDAAPFSYVDQGRFAILGRGGVGVIGEARLTGTAAWLAAKLAQQWSSPGDALPQLRAYSVATGSKT